MTYFDFLHTLHFCRSDVQEQIFIGHIFHIRNVHSRWKMKKLFIWRSCKIRAILRKFQIPNSNSIELTISTRGWIFRSAKIVSKNMRCFTLRWSIWSVNVSNSTNSSLNALNTPAHIRIHMMSSDMKDISITAHRKRRKLFSRIDSG